MHALALELESVTMTECDMSLQVFLGSLTRICSISMTLYYAALIIPKRNSYLSSSNAKDSIRFGGDMRDLTEIWCPSVNNSSISSRVAGKITYYFLHTLELTYRDASLDR